VTNVVPIGVTTDHAIISPDGKEVWTTSNSERAIYVVDAATEKVTATIKMPNDGDTHGSTFVRYDKDGKGEVVSSFTGLRGSARADQLKSIAQTRATLVKASPRGTGFDPATLKLPAGKQFVRLLNSGGTSGGAITVDVPGAGQFELKPGESRTVEIMVPQAGELKITNPKNANYKPLVITAGAAGAGAQAPASDKTAVTISFNQLQFETKSLTVKAGETLALTVKNPDDEKHNLVVLNTKIVSPDVSAGRSATFDLTMPDAPGTYKVVCAYHPNTSFELKVEAK
jgi:YVTN family beta-propeller protein